MIQSETAGHRYIAVQVTKNPPKDVASCPKLRTKIGARNALVAEIIWSNCGVTGPTPGGMNPPAMWLAHRHRPAAADAEIALVGGRGGEFTRSKLAVNDLVVGVA